MPYAFLWTDGVPGPIPSGRAVIVEGMGDTTGTVQKRAMLAARGMSETGLAAAIERGRLRRIAFGSYTDQEVGEKWEEYRLRSLACAQRITGSAVVSHQSAGSLHLMPMLLPDMERVHVTVDARSGGGVRPQRHAHVRPLREQDVVNLDGVRVTSRARTAADIALGGDFEQAITVFDGARRVWRYPVAGTPDPVGVAELESCLELLGRCHGIATARRALAASSCRSESVGESWSRSRMIEWGLPMPQQQVRYLLGGQEYFADFTWDNVIGEFDGMDKYDDPEVIAYEKDRDSDFRAAGFVIFHWRWPDLKDRRRFFRLLTSELVRGGILREQPQFPG